VLYTVGHSTHELYTLVELLRAHGVELLADVRTVPRSRRLPHFNADRLAASLPERGIANRHLPALGGWRRPRPGSPNAGWRNSAFRGYADHMLTPGFAQGFTELMALTATARTAVMCSEGLWWRCHRRLIADRVLADGGAVWHIGPDGRLTAHAPPAFAEVGEGRVLYPPPPRLLDDQEAGS
jgi:uncharacterized protein (DUF488 family)